MINLFFIIGIAFIVLIGLYLIKENLKEIKYRNSKAYLKAINKVKPKLKK